MRLDGRVALVTGGSSGIGRATVEAFARAGAAVAVAGRRTIEGEEAANAARDLGVQASYFQTDVTQASEVAGLIDQTVAVFGRLDFAFNNAGTGCPVVRTADCDELDWDRVVAVNLKGVWLGMKYQIRHMLTQGGGVVVNNASIAGLVGMPLAPPPYVASKHAVVGLTRTAALEYAADGIRICAICPGPTRTPILGTDPTDLAQLARMVPLERIAEPSEVAAVVVWLCSDAASFVTGAIVPIDGGYTAR